MTTRLPKIAIVYDQATDEGYGDTILSTLNEAFPSASVYTPPKVRSLFKQKLHIIFPKLHLSWFRKLDVSTFDIIITFGSSFTKHIQKTRNNQTLIHYSDAPVVAPALKKIDLKAAQAVDVFIATSSNAQLHIKALYDKPATVVHPPIDITRFTPPPRTDRNGYIIWGQHTPDNQFDLAIKACNKLRAPLIIVGDRSDTEHLKELAGPTITFTGHVSHEELVRLAHHAKAFLSPGNKSFDSSAAEALAAGTPVIGYTKGGVQDIVQEGETGVLFSEQTVDSLADAIERFESYTFLPATLYRKSKRFAPILFAQKMQKIVIDNTHR